MKKGQKSNFNASALYITPMTAEEVKFKVGNQRQIIIIAVNALILCNFEKNDLKLNEDAEFKGGCWVKSWKLW